MTPQHDFIDLCNYVSEEILGHHAYDDYAEGAVRNNSVHAFKYKLASSFLQLIRTLTVLLKP